MRGRNGTFQVRIKLLGRRDGDDVPGIGKTARVGKFSTYTDARRAAESWWDDPSFHWEAEVVFGKDPGCGRPALEQEAQP
jgi:hypothetical protein